MKQRNFKIVSLLTVFTIVLNVLSALVLMAPAKAMTVMTDTMSRLQASVASTHTVVFTALPGALEADGTISLDLSAFVEGVGFDAADVSIASDGATFDTEDVTGAVVSYNIVAVTDETDPITITIIGSDLVNPAAGTVTATITILDAAAATADVGQLAYVIVDSDQVNVTGYITTSLTFDLDTGTTIADYNGTDQMTDTCASNACLAYATGDAAGNYTVDLGNLVSGEPNISADSVLHQDGGTGAINYIGFDLGTNAADGAVVTMLSANGALMRGVAVDNWDIPSSAGLASQVADIAESFTFATIGTGMAYGWRWYDVPSMVTNGTGINTGAALMPNLTDCSDAAAEYCDVETTAEVILSTGDSVQDLRGTLMLGALANGTNPAGTYVDTLTFIATSTY